MNEANDSKPSIRRTAVLRLLVPAATVLVLKGQSTYLLHAMLGFKGFVEEPRLENCLLFFLFALLTFLPGRLCVIAGIALTLGSSVVGLIDAAYYRFFKDFPSWFLLPGWRQTGKVGDSLDSVLRGADSVLFLGCIVVIVMAWLTRSAWKQPYGLKIPCALLTTSVLISGLCFHSLVPVRHEQLQRRFQNVAISKVFGPLFYHAYDSFEIARITLGLEGGEDFDPARVAPLIEKSRALSGAESPFLGMFQGQDLIFIQLESLEDFALHAEVSGKPVMPFLQRMAKAGFSFRLFDQTHLGRSADGEFIYLNSLHPPGNRPLPFAYPNNQFAGLPVLFKEKGYETTYFHPSDPNFWNSRSLAKSYGFENLLFRQELPIRDKTVEKRGWGLTDKALFERVVETAEYATAPFFYYVVTMMCHHPYKELKVSDTNFPAVDNDSMVRCYLRCANLRDQSIQALVEELGKTERGRRTVLCLIGDHDSNLPTAEKNLLGLPSFPESEAVPMVLCTVEAALSGVPLLKGTQPTKTFGAQMDVAPTLGHVFALNMEQSVFLGWNLLSKQKNDSRMSRLGTWMDPIGTIKASEDSTEVLDTSEFEVSEMLLQNDSIREMRDQF